MTAQHLRGFGFTVGLLAALALVACADRALSPGEANDDDDDLYSDDDAADDDMVDDDDVGDDDDSVGQDPCQDSEWGEIPQDGTEVLLVAPWGTPSGDGSEQYPFEDIATALAAAQAMGDPVVIGLATGVYTTNVELLAANEGLTLAGCGADEVTIIAADTGLPTIAVRQASRVTLSGFTLSSGTPGIAITQGAGGGAPVEVRGIEIEQAVGAGIVIDGTTQAGTDAVIEQVKITDTQPFGAEFGWGIAVQQARATLLNGSITGGQQAGIYGHVAQVTIEGMVIEDVATDADSAMGRGIFLQLMSSGSIVGNTISGCHDAGIFLNGCQNVDLENNTVTGTLAAVVPESGATTGDAIVLSMGPLDFDAEFFPAHPASSIIDGQQIGRAGIVVDGVYSAIQGSSIVNTVFSPGGFGIVAQNGALIEPGGDDFYDIDADPKMDPLSLNLTTLNWMVVAND